ncbi:MAG: hypothetical protein D6798_14470 [Deltaproteobacteria bacterium]|nr:MAG: hypothetical protein D6798_14470 [Deltaproteobacteria bacterium]
MKVPSWLDGKPLVVSTAAVVLSVQVLGDTFRVQVDWRLCIWYCVTYESAALDIAIEEPPCGSGPAPMFRMT